VEQKKLFEKRMREYLVDLNKDESTSIGPCLFVYAHQADNRPFNRGAMKNIGFLAMKKQFANHYKDITFVFHDVDTFPAKNGILPYKTETGVVKHYYGFTFALGGIFAIKGGDFEKSNGFPNFWGWGLEDNAIYDRCISTGLSVDRSIFYEMSSDMIERPFDGDTRLVSKRDSVVYKQETPDSLKDITNIKYDLVEDMNNENKSNSHTIFMANIKGFDCVMDPNDQDFYIYDIKSNKGKIKLPAGYSRRSWSFNNLLSVQNKKRIINNTSNTNNASNTNNTSNTNKTSNTNTNKPKNTQYIMRMF
jgi:hypothetical protein